jgi:signal transduction histidine kinase
MGDSAHLAGEQPYKLEMVSTLIRWILRIGPFTSAIYLAVFVMNPNPVRLIPPATTLLAMIAALWCRSRVRQGELLLPARVFTVIFFIVISRFLLYSEVPAKLAGAVGLALTIHFATAMDHPRLASRWAGVGVAFYAAGNLLQFIVKIPETNLGVPGEIILHTLAAIELSLVALLCRSITQHLRQALGHSELSRRQLDRSNQELQSFAHVVSHDLRAPLRALTSYSRFLHEDCAAELGPRARQYVEGIADSAKHMDALVVGLLEYARVGSFEVTPEPVKTRELLAHLVNTLHLQDRADVTLPEDAPTVVARPVRLEQIFRNLLDNAAKFHRGGMRPAVAVEWADRPDAWEFAVRDNGIGIAARDLEKLFGMFQRLHAASEYEGTGIGLAVVKKAVEEHGGTIWVESRPEEGSTFRFTLPKPGAASSPTSELAAAR